jgi:SAM-dependent methyltransferase
MDLQTKRAWDKEYRRRGVLWRGKNFNLYDILRYLNKKDLILDLGCGNGKTLMSIFEMGFNVIGMDVSIYALKLIDQKVDLVQGDILASPFEEARFDKILMIHILDHFLKYDREKIIDIAYNLLKPGGLIFIEVFDTNDFRVGKGKTIENFTYLRGNNIFTHYFSYLELIDLLKKFEIVYKKNYEKNRIINKKIYIKNSLFCIAKKY